MNDKKEEKAVGGGFFSMLKGFFSRFRNYLPAGGSWKMPAILGLIAGVAISGPIGLGVAGGMYAASKLVGKSSGQGNGQGDAGTSNTKPLTMMEKGKNAALMATGAAISATCTGVGAAIGTAIFPVVGTLIGAVIGLVGGMIASKVITTKVKNKYMSPSAAQSTPAPTDQVRAKEPAKGKIGAKERENVVAPVTPATPGKEQGQSIRGK